MNKNKVILVPETGTKIKGDPKLADAIMRYTNPTSPTFGNKIRSCEKAGYESANPLNSPLAKEEIERIVSARVAASEKAAEYLAQHALEAAAELVRQLGGGQDIVTMDPREGIPDLETRGALTKDEEAYVKGLTAHNRVAVQAIKERRGAVELMLAYKLGLPTRNVEVTSRRDTPDEVDLSKLSDDELVELGKTIEDLKKLKARGRSPSPLPLSKAIIEEADFEVESSDSEPPEQPT